MSVRFTNATSVGGAIAGAVRAVARTANAGVAAINGTQTTLSYTVPNDGQLHSVEVSSVIVVATAETGGAWKVIFTINGVTIAAANAPTIHNGNLAAGTTAAGVNVVCDPGSTVSIQQTSALTVGAATVYQIISADA